MVSLKAWIMGKAARIRPKMPDILMGVGTAGVVGGTVMACKATLKLPGMLDEYREQKKKILEDAGIGPEDEIPSDVKTEIRKAKIHTGGKIVLNYTPSVVVEATSLAGMWKAYSLEKKALIGLGAAYMTLHNGFEKYRENVRKEYGEEADEKMMYSFQEEELVEMSEDGGETTKKIRVYPNDYKNMPSPYARYFCYGEADGAERSLDYNLHFAEAQQSHLPYYLKANKKVLLNDVYEFFGIKKSVAGSRVGWIYDPDDPVGDNRIDLRIQVVYRETVDSLGNRTGIERVVMIDPNVDGPIEEKAVRMGLMTE